MNDLMLVNAQLLRSKATADVEGKLEQLELLFVPVNGFILTLMRGTVIVKLITNNCRFHLCRSERSSNRTVTLTVNA